MPARRLHMTHLYVGVVETRKSASLFFNHLHFQVRWFEKLR